MRLKHCIVGALWELAVVDVEVLEYHILYECFTIEGLHSADDIKISSEHGEGFTIDSDSQHTHTLAIGASCSTWAIAF